MKTLRVACFLQFSVVSKYRIPWGVKSFMLNSVVKEPDIIPPRAAKYMVRRGKAETQ